MIHSILHDTMAKVLDMLCITEGSNSCGMQLPENLSIY